MQKETRIKLALAGASVVMTLIILEGMVQVFLSAPQTVRVRSKGFNPTQSAPDQVVENHPGQSSIYVHTPTGGRLRPNTHVTIENHRLSGKRVEIETNSLGYRNREIGEKRGRRILFLGDSITFSDYLPDAETFVRQVEKMAREGGQNWETVNAGVGAIGLENELAILMETGISIDPDVVVVCWYLNDFHASPGVRIQRLPWPFDLSRLATHVWWLYNRAIASADRRLGAKGGRDALADSLSARGGTPEQVAFDNVILSAYPDWGGAWAKETWPVQATAFERMRDLASTHGFQLSVVAFPVRGQVEASFVEDLPQRRLKVLMADLDLPLLDLLPVLRGAYTRSIPLFLDHCHHTAEGSELIAPPIHDFLVARAP